MQAQSPQHEARVRGLEATARRRCTFAPARPKKALNTSAKK